MQERQGTADSSCQGRAGTASVPIISSACSIGISAPHEAYLTVADMDQPVLQKKAAKFYRMAEKQGNKTLGNSWYTSPLTLASSPQFTNLLSGYTKIRLQSFVCMVHSHQTPLHFADSTISTWMGRNEIPRLMNERYPLSLVNYNVFIENWKSV
jgi:hypothetical protein